MVSAALAKLQVMSLIFSLLRTYLSTLIPPVTDQDDFLWLSCPIHRLRIRHTGRGMQQSSSSSVKISLNRAQSATTLKHHWKQTLPKLLCELTLGLKHREHNQHSQPIRVRQVLWEWVCHLEQYNFILCCSNRTIQGQGVIGLTALGRSINFMSEIITWYLDSYRHSPETVLLHFLNCNIANFQYCCILSPHELSVTTSTNEDNPRTEEPVLPIQFHLLLLALRAC